MQEERRVLRIRRRVAAVDPRPERATSYALPAELDWLCIRWGTWCRTRRYYGAPNPRLQSVIGQLRVKGTAPSAGPGIAAGAELARFHQGVVALDDKHRLALEAYYVHRLRPIKAVAATLQISRPHFYKLVYAGATQAYRTAQRMQDATNGR